VGENAVSMTELLAVGLVPQGLEVVVRLLVCDEVKQTQELAMNAPRGSLRFIVFNVFITAVPITKLFIIGLFFWRT
jgi:hypothetical protein